MATTIGPKNFVVKLNVVYTDDPARAPTDRLREWQGGNPDINAGFSGKYVWLQPVYGTHSWEAFSSFDVVVQDSEDQAFQDLGKGAGGQYRYLIPVRDERSMLRITEVALYRTSSEGDITSRISPLGFNGHSTDINKGRGGDFLYLVWKTDFAY